MSELELEITALRRLVGDWAGGGRGDFPTIDAFRYSEALRFYWNGVEPMLQFEQRTWMANASEPHKEPLHWEAGFFRALPGLGVEITNAQNGERVEVLRGTIEPTSHGLILSLESTLLGNDERMIRTRRRYECEGDTLRYQIWMATTRQPDLTLHLDARLTRRIEVSAS